MITVLGASGFIGSNLVNELGKRNIQFNAPTRDADLSNNNMGHIIYCIGMTADFRTKPFETVDAHVCKLKYVLENCLFDSLTYLSSTRMYLKSESVNSYVTEEDNIVINSSDAFDLFAATKITGELLALNSGKPNIKIARLSNVFGTDLLSDNFISSIIRDALKHKKIELFTSPDSAKDYIAVEDVCNALLLLSKHPGSGIYNLAYGTNTSNTAILNEIKNLMDVEIKYSSNSKKVSFKKINISKLTTELGFKPTKTVLESLPEIISAFNQNYL